MKNKEIIDLAKRYCNSKRKIDKLFLALKLNAIIYKKNIKEGQISLSDFQRKPFHDIF